MTGIWSRWTTITISAAVLAMGAGIWRQSTQARVEPPAPPPAASGETAPVAGDSKQELEELVKRFGARLKASPAENRPAVVSELLAGLQSFVEQHPRDPIADQARLTLGQLQLQLGRAAESAVTFRQIVDQPRDPKLAPVAQFYLAQALVGSGEVDAARQLLTELAASAESEQVRKLSQKLLAQLKARAEVRPGGQPPAFEARDLKGRTQSLDRYRGKVVLIDFWATWCGPCIAELPNVRAVYEQYKDRGFAILGVSLDRDRKVLESFVADRNLQWPQLCDGKESEIARLYGVSSIPRTVLVDRSGVIRYVDVRGEELEKAVAELVGQPAG